MPRVFESANDYSPPLHYQQQQQSYFPPLSGNTISSFNPPPSLPSLPPLPPFEGASQSDPSPPFEHAPKKSPPPSAKRPAPYERGLGPRGITLHRGEACLHCRKRKMRCDGKKPACGPCAKAGKGDDCEYEEDKFLGHIARLEAEVDRLRARNQELESSPAPAFSALSSSASTSLGPSPTTPFSAFAAVGSRTETPAVTVPTSAMRSEMPLEQPRPTLTPGVNIPSEAFGRMMSLLLPRASEALHLPLSSQSWLRMLVARGRPVPAQNEVLVEAACAVALGLYALDAEDEVAFTGNRQANARTFVLRAEGALARAFMFLGATDTTALFPISSPITAYGFPSALQLQATTPPVLGGPTSAEEVAFTAHRFLLAPSPSSPAPSMSSSSSGMSQHPFSSPFATVPRKMQPGRSPLSLSVSTSSSPPPVATALPTTSSSSASSGVTGLSIEFLRRTMLHTIQSLCLLSTLAFAHGRALEGHKHLGSALRLAAACGLDRIASGKDSLEEWYPHARDTWYMLLNTDRAWSVVAPSLQSESSVLQSTTGTASPAAGLGSPGIGLHTPGVAASLSLVTRAHTLAARANHLSHLLQTSGGSAAALFHPVQTTVAALENLVQVASPDPTLARTALILSLSALARLYDGLYATGMLVEEHAPGGVNAARGVAAVLRSCDMATSPFDDAATDAWSTLEPCIGHHVVFVEGFLYVRVQRALSFGFGEGQMEDADLRTIQDALRRLQQWMPYVPRDVPHIFAS